MNFKSFVVRTMAVFALVIALLLHATPSMAAETEKSYTNKELKMLSSIIFCEAGNQSYAGKLAVGIVVMNRKDSSKFPNSIQGVLKQRCQFTPVRTGKWAKEMKKYSAGAYKKGVRKQCEKAAIEVLEGRDTVTYKGKDIDMSKYLFFSQHLRNAKLRIGGHDFKTKY
ncbi:MAG: cell wall hydrolase [Eubacterium sp.]|nr:cell wall hydrolase [Eubacterium sp.]